MFINCEKVFSCQMCLVRDKFNQNYFWVAKILTKLCYVIFLWFYHLNMYSGHKLHTIMYTNPITQLEQVSLFIKLIDEFEVFWWIEKASLSKYSLMLFYTSSLFVFLEFLSHNTGAPYVTKHEHYIYLYNYESPTTSTLYYHKTFQQPFLPF